MSRRRSGALRSTVASCWRFSESSSHSLAHGRRSRPFTHMPMNRREFGQLLGAAAFVQFSASMNQPSPAAPDEICDASAIDLVSRIRRKQLSSRDVMSAHLARIERVNPGLNAIVTLVADRAMADAAKADEAQ